ncbi:hypothetical protein CXG81DRAFT_27832 [Caulochytrium protostelioides]|uniref:Mitochondrial zinc maintenance protein 1, mitochondrial n=1 Tax=Caulochytrium protostelioides TaxID=1555241 RepID=A0A4P9X325_9FUNG|nr:hypothetical protein CXG81DRAFT_27832 [Caulochytrium protostelioides]|eukprot:RKO99413.1 hypothetical protein CXG81DRAFT_27832 [Caulochytrium protostelioides]
MSVPLRQQVVQAYRVLLRSQKKTFAGDIPRIRDARAHTHRLTAPHKNEQDAAKITKMIADMKEAAEFLTRNVVQAVRTEPSKPFQLRITPETQLFPNETAYKNPKNKTRRCARPLE